MRYLFITQLLKFSYFQTYSLTIRQVELNKRTIFGIFFTRAGNSKLLISFYCILVFKNNDKGKVTLTSLWIAGGHLCKGIPKVLPGGDEGVSVLLDDFGGALELRAFLLDRRKVAIRYKNNIQWNWTQKGQKSNQYLSLLQDQIEMRLMNSLLPLWFTWN